MDAAGAAFLCLMALCFSVGFAAVCDHQYQKSCFELSKIKVQSKDAFSACGNGKLSAASTQRKADYIAGILKEKKLNAVWVKSGPAFSMGGDVYCAVKLNKNGEAVQEMTLGDYADDDCPNTQKLFAVCEFDVKAAPVKKCKVHDSLIANGFLSPCIRKKGVEPGTVMTVECWTGYLLHGKNEIRCKDNGKWSRLPNCEPVCAASLLRAEGITIHPLLQDVEEPVQYYQVNQSAVITCDNGILSNSSFPVTHKIVTCLGSNRWSEIYPQCIPFNRISFSYPMMAKNLRRVPNLSSVSIDCPAHKEEFWVSKTWSKDQRQLDLDSSKNRYSVSAKGTLTIKDFTFGDEGKYVCTIETQTAEYEFISYELRVESSQALFTPRPLQLIKIREGESRVLFCNESTYFSKQKWYKNGMPYFGTNLGSTITDDGALYLSNVSPLDDGFYLCVVEKVRDGGDSLLLPNPYQVKVISKGNSICGRLFYGDYDTETTEQEEEQEEEEEDDSYQDHTPWFVSLFEVGAKTPFCYGSLIEEAWIITTASCLKKVVNNLENLVARIGMNPIDEEEDDEYAKIKQDEVVTLHFVHPTNYSSAIEYMDDQRHFYFPFNILHEQQFSQSLTFQADSQELIDIAIKQLIPHPDYTGHTDHNLALVELQQPVEFTKSVRPICLPNLLRFTEEPHCEEARIRNGTVTTRGDLAADTDMKTIGKFVDLHRRRQCEKMLEIPLPDHVICTEDRVDYSDEKQKYRGDLGSPLEIFWLQQYTLWGVYTGRRGRYYEFFTEVLPYLDWISDTVSLH